MILLFLLILVLAVVLGGSYYAYRIAFYNPYTGREKVPNIEGTVYTTYRSEIIRLFDQIRNRPCEEIKIDSEDGLELFGRYYHVQDGAPLDIGFHGYRSSALTDFSGGSELVFDMGHNLLLVDQRAHGKSQGSTISFGIKERLDLFYWVQYAVERFGADVKILLQGVSMGGATVLMASELELPENVKGIIADCPYSSALEIILQVGRDYPIPGWLMKPFVILGAKIYGGFDIRETDAYEAVKHAKVPILIIHGESDTFVPCKMSELQLHNPQYVKRYTFPGADHGISYLVDTPRYQKLVKAFAEAVL